MLNDNLYKKILIILMLVWAFSGYVPFFGVPEAYAATSVTTLRPDQDVQTGWTCTDSGSCATGSYTVIDEVVSISDTPTTATDFLLGSGSNKIEESGYQDVTDAAGTTVDFNYHIYADTAGNSTITAQLSPASNPQAGPPWSTITINPSSGPGWFSSGTTTITCTDYDLAGCGTFLSNGIEDNMTTSKGPGPGTDAHVYAAYITIEYTILTTTNTTIEQVAYRWFENVNSTAVGDAGGYNTPIIAPKEGTPVRLRMLLHVDGTDDLTTSGTTSKIQLGENTTGDCSAATYSDVSGSTAITWIDNASPSDGAALTSNVEDPTHAATTSSHATIKQTYNESNNFTNSQGTVDVGADMLFDFSFSVSTTSLESAKGGKTYCFRAVQEGGGSFAQETGGGYTVYPELSIDKPLKTRLRGVIRLRVVRLR